MDSNTSLSAGSPTAPMIEFAKSQRNRLFSAGQLTAAIIALVAACAFPTVAGALDQSFYVSFGTRILIYVIAVTSLNLLVGYAGLISFGHAAYLGVGAYSIAGVTLMAGTVLPEWANSAWFAWPFAMLVSALLAACIGAMALRTRTVYFIMVTLAFSQMLFFLFNGMNTFGSDSGMSLPSKSALGFGMSLDDDNTFYYVVLLLTAMTLLLLSMVVRSRFGVLVRGIAENESRMAAIGVPVYRYKLICFVLGGAFAGLAGALLANQSSYVSPRLLDWIQSGTLLMMLILGGIGYRCGGIYGTVFLLVVEEVLSSHTEYWQFFVGIGLIIVVLAGNNGIASLFDQLLSLFGRKKTPAPPPAMRDHGDHATPTVPTVGGSKP